MDVSGNAGKMSSMGSCIKITDMVVDCGDFVLGPLSLDVASREIFALLGQTGSGKSVLLESLVGAFDLRAGRILVDGEDAADIPIGERSIGMVYQDYALFPHMTVLDNVAYGLLRHKVPKAEARAMSMEMLERFGIERLAKRYPDVISGGEAQRTALARALVLNPRLLLLDEPFSALDPATKDRMYVMMREIHEAFGCTIIFVTHDFNEAQALADRVGIMLDGKLREIVKAGDLFNRTYDDDIEYFLGRTDNAPVGGITSGAPN